ncbi:Aspartic proteinase nepenthesin-1 [Hordeum vulgare]|nr:Aspartic proteinase nepenthesin-1 [Hordeum vulgare]
MYVDHPSSDDTREQAEAARDANHSSRPNTSTVEMPKTKSIQMMNLLRVTHRINQGLYNLVNNQESLERGMETKFHSLDVKATYIATNLEKLKEDIEAWMSDSDGHNIT